MRLFYLVGWGYVAICAAFLTTRRQPASHVSTTAGTPGAPGDAVEWFRRVKPYCNAVEIATLFANAPLTDELAQAMRAIAALPKEFARHLAEALADELPLLKRDGGFLREGYDGDLDEARGLATESRRIILGMERDLQEETGIRSLKIRHNNVLGYYIEVTANHQAAMNGTDERSGNGRLHGKL